MTDERGACIDPGAIAPEDLAAYAAGEAMPAAARHIERCPACRAEAEQYARIDRVLTATLFRRGCPESLTIGEFALGLLPAEQRLTVAAHIAECPHCAEERRGFERVLREPLVIPASPGLLTALRRLIARPLPAPSLALAGLRGDADGDSAVYEADGLRLTVSVQRAAPGARGSVLAGMVHEGLDPDAVAIAHLYDGDTLLQTEAVDDLGAFLFHGVRPGAYRIEVTVPDAIVVIDPLVVS